MMGLRADIKLFMIMKKKNPASEMKSVLNWAGMEGSRLFSRSKYAPPTKSAIKRV